MFVWPESDIINHLLHQFQFSKDPFSRCVKAVHSGSDKSNVANFFQLVGICC